MSYASTIAFANVLLGIRIPHRDGRPLGATDFANMHAAYDELPEDLKQRLTSVTALHDFNKFGNDAP
jgi:taurine dioxygenase